MMRMAHRSASRRRPWLLITVLAVLLLGAAGAAALVLSGGDFRSSAAPRLTAPAPAPGTGDAAAAPSDSPPTAAEQVAERVRTELSALAADGGTPDREQVAAAMTAAGLPAETLRVSQDITPTGLAVDSVVAAGNVEGSCVFGEVRNGAVNVAVLPALSDGSCFIGGEV